MDPLSIAISLLYSAEAWRNDAMLYTGSRREWRLSKAVQLERRAVELEIKHDARR